ncbi:ubiquitin carboxyl-terminal hydrolase domain-containing protein [Ditylenchus destructor]|nr:ubiquitin carboxyl-terminal hydrolase domain-containing protein [Ditylenchus destructor]
MTPAVAPGHEQAFFHEIYQMFSTNIDKFATAGKVNRGHTALGNLTNTCFMNAILQPLFHSPAFSALFQKRRVFQYINTSNAQGTKGDISLVLALLMDTVSTGKYKVVNPMYLLEVFDDIVNPELANGKQHDAQEFLTYLLDALHEDTRRSESNGNFSASIVKDHFSIKTESCLSCTSCSATSTSSEEMTQINVELPSDDEKKDIKLKKCLKRHFADALLNGKDRWKCSSCNEHQVACKSIKIKALPPILIIHLKRFEGHDKKKYTRVNFPHDFDMASFLHEDATKQETNYELYAVTNHCGKMEHGHYTAFVKNLYNSQEWLKFNDSECTPINASDVVTNDAYILYYIRSDIARFVGDIYNEESTSLDSTSSSSSSPKIKTPVAKKTFPPKGARPSVPMTKPMFNKDKTSKWNNNIPFLNSLNSMNMPNLSIPSSLKFDTDHLVSKEKIANEFVLEAVVQLLPVFGVTLQTFCKWLFGRGQDALHRCGRCGRRAGKYCKLATRKTGESHLYRICKRCCDCEHNL